MEKFSLWFCFLCTLTVTNVIITIGHFVVCLRFSKRVDFSLTMKTIYNVALSPVSPHFPKLLMQQPPGFGVSQNHNLKHKQETQDGEGGGLLGRAAKVGLDFANQDARKATFMNCQRVHFII